MKPHPGVNAACNPAAWPREDDPDALVARFPYVGPRLRGDDPDALVAHQGRLAEEAFDQVHRQLGGRVAGVQDRVDLDDVQRPHASAGGDHFRSEEHTSELQSLMRISYAVFCLKNKKTYK